MQSAINNPTLKIGSRGQAVRELQELLNRRVSSDYRLNVDGVFGSKTEAVVKICQYLYFLVEDGIVGPKTWKALRAGAPVDMPILKRGSEGKLVKQVQRTLNEGNDTKLVVDGMFGPKTEAAIQVLQQSSGREVDQFGKIIVGPKTWKRLSDRRAFFQFD